MKPFLAALIVFLCMVGGVYFYGSTLYEVIIDSHQTVSKDWQRVKETYDLRQNTVAEFIKTAQQILGDHKNMLKDIIRAQRDCERVTKEVEPRLSKSKISFREYEKAQNAMGFALEELFKKITEDTQLKQNGQYQEAYTEIATIEEHLKKARDIYNESAEAYNVKIFKFPTAFVAMFFGFERRTTFKNVEVQ